MLVREYFFGKENRERKTNDNHKDQNKHIKLLAVQFTLHVQNKIQKKKH